MTVIKAEATGESERIRGAGDAERNRIFAEAFGPDPDFFAFYRSMQAYEGALRPGDTRLLLSPNSQFFQYFNSSMGKAAQDAIPGPASPPQTPESPSGNAGVPEQGGADASVAFPEPEAPSAENLPAAPQTP